MYEILVRGGLPFTGPQTVLALVMLALIAKKGLDLFVWPDQPLEEHRKMLTAILQIGIFAFFFGVLGQALGIMMALQAIREAADISLAIVLDGFGISMIAPVYGLIIFLVSLASWSVLQYRYNQLAESWSAAS